MKRVVLNTLLFRPLAQDSYFVRSTTKTQTIQHRGPFVVLRENKVMHQSVGMLYAFPDPCGKGYIKDTDVIVWYESSFFKENSFHVLMRYEQDKYKDMCLEWNNVPEGAHLRLKRTATSDSKRILHYYY